MKKITAIILTALLVLTYSCKQGAEEGSDQEQDAIANAAKTDPLPSWNEGVTKTAIIDFVTDVTKAESENFIDIADRIATFDNDGNLWSEQPAYFQLFFAIDRIKALAPQHP